VGGFWKWRSENNPLTQTWFRFWHVRIIYILSEAYKNLGAGSVVKKRMWISLLLILLASILALSVFIRFVSQPSQTGFSLVSTKDNSLLLSDADVVSYNWTSQEVALTDAATQRLTQLGDALYSFSDEFVIKIGGEEIYRGVFRTASMSAIPEPPKISIMFPSVFFPSETENDQAMRMFFPFCQPPSDKPEQNLKLSQYFEGVNKLTH
jgi:hypothetical protein